MASEEYKESEMAKIVKRLMDEEGFEFGEAVREAMEQIKNFESKADGGSIGIEVLFGPKREEYQTGGQAYSSKATAQDYAKALQNVSAGTTYQQQAAAEKYAKQQANIMLEQAMKSADPSKGPGLQGIYDTFFKNKNTGIGSNVFSPGASGKMISYSSRDKDRILNTMANQMLDTTNYSQTKKRNRKAEAEAAQYDAYMQAFANKQAQTYGKASDYAAEAMTLGMPVEAYYDYLVTGDEKDLQYKYQQAVDGVTNPYYDAKFSSYSDVYGPDLPRNPYQQYFRNVTDQQTQQGIPIAQRIQQGQVMGLPGAGASMSSNPGYQSYASLLAANKKMLGLKDGGRVPMVSGGALKAIGSGIMKLFSKGDDAVDLAKQEEIFRSGNITTDFLENVDDKVIEKFIRTRDTKGVGGYGMYDSFAEMPNGLKAAELISRIKTADGGINYEAAELFIGKKLKGDETVNELISMVITEKKADGGRVGLFMGGPALEGQALNIYNSMNSYGFSDQEIANALQGQGLYTPPGSGTPDTPPTTIQPIGFQGGGGGDITELQETFTTEPGDPKNYRLSQLEGTTDYFPPTTMMGKTKNFIKDKFFQPKVKGTLGDRLLKQSQEGIMSKVPLPGSMFAKFRSPFNPESPTYNAALPMQLNFLEATTGKKITGTSDNLKVTEGLGMIGRDPNSGLLKYGAGSVLAGKNVISGFGTNDYETALRNYISKMASRAVPGKPLTTFQQAKLDQANAELEALNKEKMEASAANRKEAAAITARLKKEFNEASGGGFNVSGPDTSANPTGKSNRASQERGFALHGAKGGSVPTGLATMFTRRR